LIFTSNSSYLIILAMLNVFVGLLLLSHADDTIRMVIEVAHKGTMMPIDDFPPTLSNTNSDDPPDPPTKKNPDSISNVGLR